jgi:hypothetical protein
MGTAAGISSTVSGSRSADQNHLAKWMVSSSFIWLLVQFHNLEK